MSVIEHQTVKLISGSTALNAGNPIDSDALIEIKGFQKIHHRDIPALVDAAPDLLEACKAMISAMWQHFEYHHDGDDDCGAENCQIALDLARAAVSKAQHTTRLEKA